MKKNSFFYRMRAWLWPLLFALLLTPFFPKIDLAISHLFFKPTLSGHGAFVSNALTQFLFRYGELLGFIVGGGASSLFILSWFIPKLKPWRQGLTVLTLTWFVGVGLLANVVFKGYWGRPRPKQITEFNGKYSYRPYWNPNFHQEEPQRSFPSGHVATGFYYLSLFLVGRRYQNKLITRTGIILTIVMGLSLTLSRIAQGGHFFSDALFAALIVWWTALFCDYFTYVSRWSRYFRNYCEQKS